MNSPLSTNLTSLYGWKMATGGGGVSVEEVDVKPDEDVRTTFRSAKMMTICNSRRKIFNPSWVCLVM